MREALMLQLEKFCYYQHLSLSGGQERPIFACRVVDIRGTRFHVLSRIQDAGLDFTGRTNFIAHHLVFTPEEIRQFPTPAVILRDWPGWVKSWTKDPQMLENEDWAELTALAGKTNVPAQTWQRVTGDAVNGYGLLEARAGASFRVDDQADEIILGLFAESLELLEVRDTRRDFRAAAWNYTFTTSMQEQDNPADFRWRCIHSDNPTASRFTPPDCRALSAVRATKWTGEETAFARTGRQAPQFVIEPHDARITEGEAARFTAKAEGVPNPAYQWFSVDRANNGQVLPGETNPELVVSNAALGVSRYIVSITNSMGNAQSKVATLSVEQKLKLAQVGVDTGSRGPAKPALYNVKSGDDIERQRRRLEAEKAQEIFHKRLRRNKILVAILAIVLIAGAGVFVWKKFAPKITPAKPSAELTSKKDGNKDLSSPPPSAVSPTTTATTQSNSTLGTGQSEPKPVEPEPNTKPEHNVAPLLSSGYDLPKGWTSVSVGSVCNVNVGCITNPNSPPMFDLSAAAAGYSSNGDNFLFVYKTNTGDEFKATLRTIRHGDSPSRECGIMLRESDKPKSPFLFIGASSQSVVMRCRNNRGEFSSNSVPKLSFTNVPVYLKLSHQEKNQFVPAYSFDNTNWYPRTTPLQAHVIFTNSPMLVGFAVCSGSLSNSVQVLLLLDVSLQTTR
jgi:GTPase-associated protein 1, N-terminal domain type 2/Immunoglobulin I-set domain